MYTRLAKRASTRSDVAGAIVGNLLPPGVGAVVGGIGGTIGMLSDPPRESDIDDMDRSQGLSFIPGVGAYRLNQRVSKEVHDHGGNKADLISMSLGPITSSALLAAALAGAGGLLGGGTGAALGGLLGAGLGMGGTYAGLMLGTYSDPRTNEEFKEHFKGSKAALANYLVPGYAGYNAGQIGNRLLDNDAIRRAKRKS